VDVGPVAAAPPRGSRVGPALLAAHDRAMAVAMAAQRSRVVAEWRAAEHRPPLVLVEPDVDPYATFAFDRTAEFIEAGYRAGHEALQNFRRTDAQTRRRASAARGAGAA